MIDPIVSLTIGGVGSGKTALNTFFTFGYAADGYTIYSNYKLYGIEYYPIQNLNSFDEIEEDKVLVNMDEIWISGDSRRSVQNIDFTKYMLQVRKLARKTKVISSSQTFAQVDKRYRDITQIIYEPEIIASDCNTGKPLVLKVDVLDWQKRKYLKSFCVPLKCHFRGFDKEIDICDSYDTAEYITSTNTNNQKKYNEIISKYYKQPDLTAADIKTLITMDSDNPLNERRAGQLAKYIKLMQAGKIPAPDAA